MTALRLLYALAASAARTCWYAALWAATVLPSGSLETARWWLSHRLVELLGWYADRPGVVDVRPARWMRVLLGPDVMPDDTKEWADEE